MITVISCITYEHDISLVILAGILCLFGSFVTARLYRHARNRPARHAVSWHLLTALTAGVTIWCTHFVAMLGFRPNAPVSFDLALTVASLLIAVIGSAVGTLFSTMVRMRFAPAVGGAILGLAIAAMHYTGMIAYRVQGIVYWDHGYLAASIVLAVVFSSLALALGGKTGRRGEIRMAGALSFGIVALHFTGMAAFTVAPLDLSAEFVNPEAFKVLAMAITGTALVIVMGALFTYVVETRTRMESISQLTAARNAAEEASRAKSEFLSVLSHELRTPLTIVLGYAGLLTRLKEMQAAKYPGTGEAIDLQATRMGDQAELYGQKISDAGNHLLGMINEILDYTGMELGDTELDRSSFPVEELLHELRDEFAAEAAAKSMEIVVESDGTVAFADRARLARILGNLVANALKFSEATRITLRGKITPTGLAIAVEDNGCGIREDHHERIFDPFQQIEHADHRRQGGAGLGLAICRKLALAHEGRILVESAEGEGATFTLCLPASALDRRASKLPRRRGPFGLRLAG